jgi:hypothetical protein
MRARFVRSAVAGAIVALSVTPVAAHAQGTVLQSNVPIRQLQGMRAPQINRDNTAQAVTVSMPDLYALMNALPGTPKASLVLRNVEYVGESANGKPPTVFGSGGVMWFDIGNAPAGYFHVRFDGTPTFGSSTATVELHLGQNASAPLIVTCTVTSSTPYCDTVVSNPGGTFSVTAIVTGGNFQFGDVYVAPTAPPGLP